MKLKTLALEVKFYQTNEFKELQKHWYRQLALNEFKDIEKEKNGDFLLKQRSTEAFRNDRLCREHMLREEYHRVLSQLIGEVTFDSELDRIILSRIAEGKKINEISNELKALGHAWHRQTIRFRIRKYENRFGIRSWEPEKLNPPWKNGRKKAATQ